MPKPSVKTQNCADCLDAFTEQELSSCICSLFNVKGDVNGVKQIEKIKRVVTKSGVKYYDIQDLFCKNCLTIKHEHKGQAFI